MRVKQAGKWAVTAIVVATAPVWLPVWVVALVIRHPRQAVRELRNFHGELWREPADLGDFRGI